MSGWQAPRPSGRPAAGRRTYLLDQALWHRQARHQLLHLAAHAVELLARQRRGVQALQQGPVAVGVFGWVWQLVSLLVSQLVGWWHHPCCCWFGSLIIHAAHVLGSRAWGQSGG